MTREHWEKMLPIITAFANGETVQTYGTFGWVTSDDLDFNLGPESYRIKPKPREFTVFLATDGTILHKSADSDDRVAQGYASFGIQSIRVREIIED